jgi:hypothetical protein
MAEPFRIDRTNAECSRRARERQRAGRISLMIEADEVALVLMLIEQNLLPENLQDDKCAITKKDFFNRRGGAKMFSSLARKTGAGVSDQFGSNRGWRGHKNAKILAEGCDASEG